MAKPATILLSPQYGLEHDEYGFGVPSLPENLRPTVHTPFLSTKSRTLLTSRHKPRVDWMSKMPEYEKKIANMLGFSDLFDEYDLREVVPATTAMGIVPLAHSDLDEGTPVGIASNPAVFDRKLVDRLIADWKASLPDKLPDGALALPLGKNLGYPFLFADTGGLRTTALAGLVAMVMSGKDKGMSLKDVYSAIIPHCGAPFLWSAYRMQHTSKLVPHYDDGGHLWTRNLATRARMVMVGSKIGVIYNREPTKKLTAAAMNRPEHNQSRPDLKTTFDSWISDKGRVLIALDVSKFDKRSGGEMLRFVYKCFGKILGDSKISDDFLTEVSMPMIVRAGSVLYQTTDRIAPQLPSGVSTTTPVGLFVGDLICRSALALISDKVSVNESKQDYRNWGDDMVISFDAQAFFRVFKTRDEFVKRLTSSLGYSFDIEPVIRYLGFNYGNDAMTTNTGYSKARLLQTLFFPERPKIYPYDAIGYWAKTKFFTDGEEFHDRFSVSGWRDTLGPVVKWKDRDAALLAALHKASEMGIDSVEAADTLNFLAHGADLGDIDLAGELGMDFDFAEWLGGGILDVDDVLASAFDLVPEMSLPLKEVLVSCEKHGLSAFPNLYDALATVGKFRRNPGDVLF